MAKIKTIFCDIDGTLIRQVRFEDLNPNEVDLLPGVHEKMNKWYNDGHYIVLTTARPENLRLTTKQQLDKGGIPYHQLVMGIGRAERILINNKSSLCTSQVQTLIQSLSQVITNCALCV